MTVPPAPLDSNRGALMFVQPDHFSAVPARRRHYFRPIHSPRRQLDAGAGKAVTALPALRSRSTLEAVAADGPEAGHLEDAHVDFAAVHQLHQYQPYSRVLLLVLRPEYPHLRLCCPLRLRWDNVEVKTMDRNLKPALRLRVQA